MYSAGHEALIIDEMYKKKANHRAPIVRIQGTLPIEGADRIERVYIGGAVGDEYSDFSFVSQKGTFKVGDVAVFIQPDSIVPATAPFQFVFQDWLGKIVPIVAGIEYSYPLPIEVPASHRRITVRRFKKTWSEGLLLPVTDFPQLFNPGGLISVGDDVSYLLGIEHYDADELVSDERAKTEDFTFTPKGKKRRPSTLKGWFFYLLHKLHVRRNAKFLRGPVLSLPVYDVENFKNYPRTFVEGELVYVTEKIHGSSARFVAVDGVFYAGSRKQWVSPKGDSYPAQVVRNNVWIEEWCRRNEGYALYGEVTPRQKGFSYGTKLATFWLFDIRDPQGEWLDADHLLYITLPMSVNMVPLLYHGPYHKDIIDQLVDGPSAVVAADHIREGVVIKTVKTDHRRGVGRAQLKVVSNAFLDRDGKLSKE